MIKTTAGNYNDSFKEFGESPKALLWSSYRIAAIRFRELVADIPVEDKQILDAGCGMGDLIPFLYSKSSNFNYLGVDTNEDFINIARKRYEGHKFEVGDAFKGDFGKFDVVITSGTLNGNVDNWLNKRKGAISSLFEKTREVLAFNMSGNFEPIEPTTITAFADIRKIIEFCSTLSTRLIVRAHYSDKGFTIIMFKNKS